MSGTDKKWWKESVVYQVYPRSFNDSNGDGIGDLNGITEKLPYLKELGVDVIWLSPVYQSPNADNGYDISNYREIMTEFGTMEDFDRMLETAHELGLKIMMDLVVNHSSDEHEWFRESRSSKDNPYRDYYIWREAKDGKEPNNWGSCFGGPAWEYDEQTDMYYLHLFAVKQPDLNWDNPRVREEVFDMMTWWCEKGIDGFRMDVINMISKDPALPDGRPGPGGYGDPSAHNGPHVHEYIQEMNRKVLSRYDLITVGECGGATAEDALDYARADGKELNMIFQFEHVRLDDGEDIKWAHRKIDLTELKQVMSKWQILLHGKSWNSLYWCNHDQPRIVSRLGNDSPEYRELSAKMIATNLHMMQGTPYIYQGEELGMTNYPFTSIDEFRDVESLHAMQELVEKKVLTEEEIFESVCYKGRDNSRTPMQWDDSSEAGFTTGTPWINVNPNYKEINAKEQVGREDSVFHYYQKLIRLRREHEIIVYGSYRLLLPESRDVYAYERSLKDEVLLVVCNFTDRDITFDVEDGSALAEAGKGVMLISNYGRETLEKQITLKPYEAFVWKYHRSV
ncbi:MAG: alpha-glucosidase [Eubacterium sp.]|nr:alpha-glucosidase [Eubacterium sp.]